jgi:sugar lactone lactonase YvrE
MKRIRLASIVFAVTALATAVLATSASATPIYAYGFSFGSAGAGDGQFSNPKGVAVDSKGNVWVADFTNDRIQEFNSEGKFLGKFGTSGTGKLDGPSDLAIDASDNVWVTDTLNRRIVKFNSKGEYQSYLTDRGNVLNPYWLPIGVAIDSEGNIWSTSSGDPYPLQKYNSKGEVIGLYSGGGSGEGNFLQAWGIAIDSEDHVWVSDFEYDRVQEFNSNGEFLTALYKDGLGNNLFDHPAGVVTDSANRVWIVDMGSNRVLAYNASGEFLRQFGSYGTGPGQLTFPLGIAADSADNFWVADSSNNRIEKWGAAPEVTTGEATSTTATLSGTVNPRGTSTTYDFEYGTTASYGASVPVPDKSVGSGTTAVNVSQAAGDLLGNTIYHYRIVATNSYGSTHGEDKTFTTPEWTLPSNPKPIGGKWETLSGVSCTSSESCAATGFYENSSGVTATLAKIKTAGKWSVTSTPNPEKVTSSTLFDVSCTAANACTAVGQAGSTSTLAERWNGSTWAIQTTPNVAGAYSTRLWRVSCVASNDCTAVGWSTGTGTAATLAEHWNGTTWTIMSTPNAVGFKKSYLFGISCVSASDCWAVGMATNFAESEASLAEHWDGSKWTIKSPAGSQYLFDVSCVSASSCVVTTDRNTVISRWNGSTWSQETAPKPEGAAGAFLNGISCTSASACRAVGEWGITRAQPLAESWNGSKWTIESTSEPAGTEEAGLTEVSCTSTTVCTSVGSYFPKGGPKWSLLEGRH